MTDLLQGKSDSQTQFSDRFRKELDKRWIFYYIILLMVFVFIAFYHLGAADIFPWDEARHGISAYEMLQTKDYIRSTFNYATDYYNLKPPLSYWCIALSYKVFGYNAFSLRFYSAISYVITGAIVSLMLKRRHGSLSSLFSLLFFLLLFDIFFTHMARKGDADALFILLYTISILLTMRYTETDQPLLLYFASLSFGLAFLTKSFHAGCIVITMAIQLLFAKKFGKLKLSTWIISFICALTPIFLWASARYQIDGFMFINKMFSYDLFKRSTQAIEGHGGSFLQYAREMNDFLSIWVLGILLIIGIVWKIITKTAFTKRMIMYFVWAIVPIILFAFVKTRIMWYMYPSLIAFAALDAVLIDDVLRLKRSKAIKTCLISAVIIACFVGIAGNVKIILNEKSIEPVQTFLRQSVNRENENIPDACYIDQVDWPQNILLEAELSSGFICKSGGFEAFLTDQTDAAFLISDLSVLRDIDLSRYTILASSEECCLIQKMDAR